MRAFTLVELLVTIAVIALLAALLMPMLTAAKSNAKAGACLNNLSQLAVGWRMYADDNQGALVANLPQAANASNWVLGEFSSPTQATNQAGIQQGLLYSEVLNTGVYRCPADNGSNGLPRVLSYAMNSWMGSRTMGQNAGTGKSADYRTFVREAEIAAIGAASRLWVLSDEDDGTLKDGWFRVTMDDSQPFVNFPGTRHHRGCGLDFADGHAQILPMHTAPEKQINPTDPDWLLFKQMTTEH